jgi:hypothetical protein
MATSSGDHELVQPRQVVQLIRTGYVDRSACSRPRKLVHRRVASETLTPRCCRRSHQPIFNGGRGSVHCRNRGFGPQEDRSMRTRLGSIGVFVTLAMTTVLSQRSATACSACADNRCVATFEQGANGCSDGEIPCSLFEKLTVGCEGRWCSTVGFPACDHRRPERPQPFEPAMTNSAPRSRWNPTTTQLLEGPVAQGLTCGTALDPSPAAQHD